MQNKNLAIAALSLAAMPMMAQSYQIKGIAPKGAKMVYLQKIESRTIDSVAVLNNGAG